MRRLLNLPELFIRHRYGLTLVSFLGAAAFTGATCVWFMRAFDLANEHRLDAWRIGWWSWLTAPALFILCSQLVRRLAPHSEGSGIQQVVFAAKHLSPENEKRLSTLLSARTLSVKVATILIAVAAGASLGREGPTVHIAACVLFGLMLLFRRITGLSVDHRSVVVAGGAAGLAAAFNTPLAGVVFAVEELSDNYFSSQIKDFVLTAIIVAAVAAKHFTGDYVYFGRLATAPPLPYTSFPVIGLAGGVLGAMFSVALIRGRAMASRISLGRGGFLLPALFAWGVLLLAHFAGPDVLGPGNQTAQEHLRGYYWQEAWLFPAAKMGSTLLTYWSGIAGGIFAPSLSIGSAMGATAGYYLGMPTAACALIGMAAFLSGTIQAPITSFVIIFEMTGHSQMLLPIMVSSLLASIVARLLGARNLYRTLAEVFQPLLEGGSGGGHP